MNKEKNEKPMMRPAPSTHKKISSDFWNGTQEHELRIQQCKSCHKLHHPPRPMCDNCLSVDMGYQTVSGRGTVYSWVMPQYPQMPMFDYPIIAALIDLDEGVRILSNICDIDYYNIQKGMPVEVFFIEVDRGYQLPQFRPIDQSPH